MYRILRNNKEQGPYNLDELVQLSLRPYDLIWIEGKSACWRYPSEIEELKPYLRNTAESNAATSAPPQPIQPIILQEIKQQENQLNVQEEETLTAAMLEQKANAIYERVQAYNAKREQEAKDVQIKYARPLEDLKKDYAEWLHGNKRKRREITSDNKGWMAFGAVSAAFLIFLLAGKDKEIAWPSLVRKDITGEKPVKTVQENGHLKPLPNVSSAAEPLSESKRSSVESFIDSMRTALRKQNLTDKPRVVPNKLTKKKGADNQVAIHPVQSILPLEEKTIIPPSIKAADLDARYIPHENSSRIKELQVTVHNTGTVALKQVTVDVYYYKKGNRFIDKETLFFTDIEPGNAYTVSKPGNKKAVSARFELGELTADN